MAEVYQAVRKLQSQAAALGHNAAAVDLLQEAVRLADLHNATELAYDARGALMTTAQFAGRPEVVLVAFTWRLGQHKADPQRFPITDLLWEYKWVGIDLVRYPQFSAAQIAELENGMADEYEHANASPRSVAKVRWWNALWMGKFDRVVEILPQWERLPRDQWADCLACDMADPAIAQIVIGNVDIGLELAHKVINSKRRCMEVPHRIYGEMVLPLLRLGRREEAATAYRAGLRLLQQNRELVRALSNYVAYLTLIDDMAGATALLERYFHWVDHRMPPLDRLYLFLGARLLTARLLATGRGDASIRNSPVTRPEPAEQSDGAASSVASAAELNAWLDRQSRELAEQFDTRNGNRYFSSVLLPAYDELGQEGQQPLA